MKLLITLGEAILLSLSLCADTFAASVTYGIKRIIIPFKSKATITAICSLLPFIAVLLNQLIGGAIPENVSKTICFLIFEIIGVWKLSDDIIKKTIRKNSSGEKKFEITVSGLKLVLSVYASPEEADTDGSKSLSVREALMLALALSADGFFAGFGTSFDILGALMLLVASIAANAAAIELGRLSGKNATRSGLNPAVLSGPVFIILGITKLL